MAPASGRWIETSGSMLNNVPMANCASVTFSHWIAGKGREKTLGDYAKLTLTEVVNEADRLRSF